MRTLTTFLRGTLLLTIVCTYASPLMAQVSERMLPYSVHTEANTVLVTYTVPSASLPPPPPEVLDGETGMPLVRTSQHGVETPVDLGFENAGQWQWLPDGGRLWRLRITSEGARSLNLIYDDFWMPEGAYLFLYNEDRSVMLGAFTEQNNKAHGGFATDLVPGEVTVLEYYEPPGVAARARLHISTVVQGRPGVEALHKLMGADEPYVPIALPCSINAQCNEGWADEAQAVVRIVQGGASCTGVLLNNTRQDRTPYVLSVNHCGAPAVGDTLDWVFQFNYKSAQCADPSQTPTPQSVSGAVVRAAQQDAADFALLELLEPIPTSYQVEYAGWSIEDNGSPSNEVSSYGVVIGHPRGDIMKITFEDDPIIKLPLLPFYWVATFDRGSIEVGSSGSPLFNDQRQVIGLVQTAYQFNPDTCSGPGGDDNGAIIGFPKLSYIWDLGLGAFLDPDNEGALSISSIAGKALIWINEVNANAQASGPQNDEFVELVGLPGTVLDGFTLDIYSCTGGATTLESSHAINSFTLQNDYVNFGIFVFGGSSLDAALRDQVFAGGGTDVLPDGSGLLVLKDATGSEVFDYQYDSAAACPTTYTTRSEGDPSGSTTMGFITSVIPTASTTASNSLAASPGAENVDGGQIFSVEIEVIIEMVEQFVMEPAYPNPFNPQAQFRFTVQRPQRVRVALFDVTGRQVRVLYEGEPTPGQMQTVQIDGGGLSSGFYLVRVAGASFVETQQVMLVK